MHRGQLPRLIGFLGIALAVTASASGWASASGSHTGLVWLCNATQTVSCNYSTLTNNTNPTHNLTFYSQASGLTANGSYDMRYVTGDHISITDAACHTGTVFTGGASLIASSTGVWSGKGPLTMPNLTGTVTVCAQTLPGNNPNNFLESKHTLWTLV